MCRLYDNAKKFTSYDHHFAMMTKLLSKVPNTRGCLLIVRKFSNLFIYYLLGKMHISTDYFINCVSNMYDFEQTLVMVCSLKYQKLLQTLIISGLPVYWLLKVS